MAQNDSRHLFPMNSILFSDGDSSRPAASYQLTNLTLANLKDAQDNTVTALPQTATAAAIEAKSGEDGFWKRFWAMIKSALDLGRMTEEDEESRLCIGEPYGFVHRETLGGRGLLGPDGRPVAVEEEDDWEDEE
jgi:hypothetical protein